MTLNKEQPEVASRVIFGFFHSFKNICFNDEFKKMFDIDTFLEVNMSGETKDIMLPQNIIDVMNSCLVKCQKYQSTPKHETEFVRFVELIQAYRNFYGAAKT